jgi:hypothetical protein
MNATGAKALQNVLDRIDRSLPEIYLVLALGLTISLSLLTPPFYVPDEIAHASREIQIGHGGLIGQRTEDGVGGQIDANAKEVMDAIGEIQLELERRHPAALHRADGRVTETQLAPLRPIRWSHRTAFMGFQNTAVYPPLLYIPQAIGWRIGEAAGFTILHSLLLARLLASIGAAAAGWLAMRLCAGGRWLLFAYLLLPTALGQNASCSQDALLLPAAGLVMALLSRAISARRLFSATELIAVTSLLAVCIASRPPYLPLAMVLVLPALETPGAIRQQFIPASIGLLAVALAVGAWIALVHPLGAFIHPLARPALQISFLHTHPLEGSEKIVFWTLVQTPLLFAQGLEVLGILDIYAPFGIYAILSVGLAGILLFSPALGLSTRRARVALILAVLAVCGAISLVEYIVFTPPEASWVACLEGRYYLPLAALACLLIRRKPAALNLEAQRAPGARSNGSRRQLLLTCAASVFLIGVLYTPWVAAHGFYNLGLGAAFQASALR